MPIKKQQLELDMEQQTGSRLGKKYVKIAYCHPAYLTSMQSKYIMQNAGLDESQAEIKIARTNINNRRYADDTTLMAEGEEEQEPLDEGERREWKPGLKINIQKTKIMASSPITSWQTEGGKSGNSSWL